MLNLKCIYIMAEDENICLYRRSECFLSKCDKSTLECDYYYPVYEYHNKNMTPLEINDRPIIKVYRGDLTIPYVECLISIPDLILKEQCELLTMRHLKTHQFYIAAELIKGYIKDGYRPDAIFQYASFTECSNPLDNTFEMNPLSMLKIYGYTVGKSNGLPSIQRHMIIDFIIKNHILSIYDVINYLQSFITLREGRTNADYSAAINDWREDINYIRKKYS